MKKKINFNKVKKLLKNLPRILAENTFLTFLFLFFLSLIFGGALFYQGTILAQKAEIIPSKELIQLNKKFYQEILIEWNKREKIFEEADLKKFSDPFYFEQEELTE